MVFAHIFGIPVEETTLALAPVIALAIVGARTYARQAHRKLRASAQRGMRKTDV
jgi:3-deoxy-D-arabino-heptulosonate 7-phosphate (DAHP) synthase